MKHKIFSIYDVKAQAYLPPFFLHADAMAQRSFQDCVRDKDHNFGRHPSDYTLFRIGEFDDEKGVILSENPQSLGNGIEYVFDAVEVEDDA